MTEAKPGFNVISYRPSQELSKLLEELVKAANKLVMHVGEVGIVLNEILQKGRNDGLLDMQIRELIDSFLGENRTIRKYLPKELKKHNYPAQRKRMEEFGTDSNVEDNKLIEDASPIESLEEIRRTRGTVEPPLP